MAEKKYRPLRIYRSSEVQESREAALIKLNEAANLVGQPVMIKYWADPETKKKIDILVALGIQDGKGPGTYRVISTGGVTMVSDVSTELPDIAQLVHGENYIYYDTETSTTYLVYLDDPERKYQKITEPQTVTALETGKTWYIGPEYIKEATDWYTTSEITEFLEAAKNNLELTKATLEKEIQEVDKTRAADKEELQGEITELSEKAESEFEVLSRSVWPVVIEYFNVTPLSDDNSEEEMEVLYKKGVSKKFKVSYKLTMNKADVTKMCEIVVLDGWEGTTENGMIITLTDDADLKLRVKFKNTSDYDVVESQDVQVRFGYETYCNTGEFSDIESIAEVYSTTDSDLLKNLVKPGYSDSAEVVYNLKLGDRIAYVTPVDLGPVKHIYDWNGLDYINDYIRGEATIEGTKYYIYLLETLSEITDFKQRFVYGD
jgi:hypothetical protein